LAGRLRYEFQYSLKGTSKYAPDPRVLSDCARIETDFGHDLSPMRLPFVCPPGPWGAAGRLRPHAAAIRSSVTKRRML
jgi:hypothetical protein